MARQLPKYLTASLLVVGALAPGCRRPPKPTVAPVPQPVLAAPRAPAAPPELPLFAPRVLAPLAVDGELAETVWRDAAHSGGFADETTGKLGVPHSELRIANDGQRVLLGLYAADEDIVAYATKGAPFDARDDTFVVQFERAGSNAGYQLEVTANGTVRESPADPAAVGAVCAVEMDGTLNVPADDDEEWVAECIIPFASMHATIGDTLLVTARRCDTPKGATRRCGTWQRRVQLQ